MKNDKISLILHNQNLPPRYFEFNKFTLKLIIVLFPALGTIALTIIVLAALYWSTINNFLKARVPNTIKKINQEKEILVSEIKELKSLNLLFQDKLANIELPFLNTLSLFRTIPGMEDRTVPPLFLIKEHYIQIEKDKIHLKFNLVNINPQTAKISGYLFVILKTSSGIQLYPKDAFLENDLFVNFSRGEPFSTTRFRPVLTTFRADKNKKKFLFRVLIFSRKGNLIHQQMIEETI